MAIYDIPLFTVQTTASEEELHSYTVQREGRSKGRSDEVNYVNYLTDSDIEKKLDSPWDSRIGSCPCACVPEAGVTRVTPRTSHRIHI